MSSTGKIDLLDAKDALESVEATVAERIDRAKRLYGLVERKRANDSHAAARARAVAARRVLAEADEALATHQAHRRRLREHVESNPEIEGGVYHGRVRTYDELRDEVDELTRRVDLELAIAGHRHDVAAPGKARGGPWERAYDVVRETIHLLGHVRGHDVPALVRAAENRDGGDGLQHPTAGISARLAAIRERMTRIESIDHDGVARNAATVNSELAADYLAMVDRLRDQHAALADDLATLAGTIGDESDAGDGHPIPKNEERGIRRHPSASGD